MGFTYHIDPLLGLAYVQLDGRICLEDVMKATIDLASRSGFDPTLRILADARPCHYRPTWSEAVAIARHLGDFRTFFEARVALVVRPRCPWMVRLCARLSRRRGFPLRLFVGFEDACAWLDRGP